MVSRLVRHALTLLVTSGLLLTGCSEPDTFEAGSIDQVGLAEIAAVYRGFTKKNQRAPVSFKEIQSLEQGFPTAIDKLRSGEIVLLWGRPTSSEGEASRTVLAYTKDTATSGGPVLMLDGKTIKSLTAEEFELAPKAATPPEPSKNRKDKM